MFEQSQVFTSQMFAPSTQNVWTKVMFCIQNICASLASQPSCFNKIFLRIQNVWAKVLLGLQNVWTINLVSVSDPKCWNKSLLRTLVPKFCIFSMQCEHNTNVSTDALRNWDQYKSQMYYINCGFILVPKFCIFSMQCDHWTKHSTDAFFLVSRKKHIQLTVPHETGTNINLKCSI